jgi:DNA-binding response OmpR family regulator
MAQLIYIADDEANIRDLMQSFLRNDGFNVQSFADGDALLAAFLKFPADMVILDIMMPGIDGLTLCSQLRRKSNIPIVIVSARDSELDRITGITLGSDDYLTKPFSPIELVARVKAIFRRIALDRGPANDAQLSAGNMIIQIQARTITCQGRLFDATPTEFALLTYLIQKKNQAISREELLRNVWQFDFDIDTRATDDVIKRLRKKMTAIDCAITIESVWGFGFRLNEGNETGMINSSETSSGKETEKGPGKGSGKGSII